MITIEVIEKELVLSAGGQQLRVALPDGHSDPAGRAALIFDLIGTAQTGLILAVVSGNALKAGGDYVNVISSDYKQCVGAVHINDANVLPDTTYNATVQVTSDGTTNTATVVIGAPA